MAAKLLPVHFNLWVGFLLLLWSSQSETSDVCTITSLAEPLVTDSSDPDLEVEIDAIEGADFFCILDLSNKLNCSWSFDKMNEDAQLSVDISVCDGETLVESANYPMGSHVGLHWQILKEYEAIKVVLTFKVTLKGSWTVYSTAYNENLLNIPTPPQNLTAVLTGGNLQVSWDLPRSRTALKHDCLEYQLDLGDQQQKPRQVATKLSYTEQNVDPSQSYRVRSRTRLTWKCQVHQQWSEWSHTVVVEQPPYKLSILVIVSISLGIPMILLAVLLLVRHHRLKEVLFPPIPRPPSKYIHFLQKNDTVGHFQPVPPEKPAEEEITQVDDTGPKSGKTF